MTPLGNKISPVARESITAADPETYKAAATSAESSKLRHVWLLAGVALLAVLGALAVVGTMVGWSGAGAEPAAGATSSMSSPMPPPPPPLRGSESSQEAVGYGGGEPTVDSNGSAQYVTASSGSNDCGSANGGGNSKITKECQCRGAANDLGYTYSTTAGVRPIARIHFPICCAPVSLHLECTSRMHSSNGGAGQSGHSVKLYRSHLNLSLCRTALRHRVLLTPFSASLCPVTPRHHYPRRLLRRQRHG